MTTSNLPANLSSALTAMQHVTSSIDVNDGDFDYLKLTKSGEWVHGADEDEISSQSVFIVDTNSFVTGYQAWGDGELLGEIIRPITEGAVSRQELDDVGAEWKPLIGCQMTCVEGADDGLQLLYKTTSKGGIKAVNNLMKEIVKQSQSNHNGCLTPEIELVTDSYKHKKYGKIFTPVLNVIGWCSHDFNDDVKPAQKAPEPVVEEEPVQVEEPQAEPTVRRRRRTAA